MNLLLTLLCKTLNLIIYFVDDDFLFDRKRIELFIKIIKEKKIRKKYICYGRVDFIIKNEDIIKELKKLLST